MALAFHARGQPDTDALRSPHGNRTYFALNSRANQVARFLRSRGLRAGDGVAILCFNRPEFAEVVAATQRSGLRLTTVNCHLNGREAGYIVDDCEAKALVADARFEGAAREASVAAARATTRLAIGGMIEGFEPYELVTEEDPSELDDPVPGWTMLYTSGTTGRPKGVYRDEPPASASLVVRFGRYRRGDVHLCTGPLYHAAPLLFSLAVPLLAGVPVVLMDKWEPQRCLELIAEHGVTHTHMVPTMFHQLLALPDDVRARYDVSSLRHVVHGAAPCPVGVKQRLIDWLGPVLLEYYAATEGLGTFVDSETWLQKPGTVGKPVPADQVVVGDEDGAPLPPGEVGLVWLKAPARARFAYFKDPNKTESTYRGEYFTIGDLGYVDEDGYLFLTDRSANLIISGGVNIYPAEVDAVLLEHPAVADVATIGVPDAEWGEEVLAVVEPRPGSEADDALKDDLLAFCRARLAHYKCPRRVEFVDALPRQDNGKIYKRLLRDHYRARA
jgi:long-chain acyl-CoA synthetase